MEKQLRNKYRLLFIFCLCGFLFNTAFCWSAPVSKERAQLVVKGWLKLDNKPLGKEFPSTQIGSVDKYTAGTDGVYYIVNLSGGGFVVVSGDDQVEPIIAFCSGTYETSSDNPLAALVTGDIQARMAHVKSYSYSADPSHENSLKAAENKWLRLESGQMKEAGLTSVSDVRVVPLVQSKWDQGEDNCGTNYLYNYYTPNHDVCGCVATAMAQLMRYYQYPTTGVGNTKLYTYYVDDVKHTGYLKGGDTYGGAYNWSNMPLEPGCSPTVTQRQQIGALCYDAGLSVSMQYTSDSSGADTADTAGAFTGTFKYSNAVFGYDADGSGMISVFNNMANPNLDASMPVLLAIRGDVGGHAIVADGYGYNSTTLYHHLNLGWSGNSDAWYNIPNINASYTFDILRGCTYNVYTSGTGEVISGRITSKGVPLSGVTVTARIVSSGTTYTATTNDKGIYFFAKIPSNTTYSLTAAKTDYGFDPRTVTTGKSVSDAESTGNRWGIDFVDVAAHPPVAQDVNVSVVQGSPISIQLQATDDGAPNPPGVLTYVITSLPAHGVLKDHNSGHTIIPAILPYTLTNHSNTVDYQSCTYYFGTETFAYVANDSGQAPAGGNSAQAGITVHVTGPTSLSTVYYTDFSSGIPALWSIVDYLEDGKTWKPDTRPLTAMTGTFMCVDSDAAPRTRMDEQLITSPFDCSEWTNVSLTYNHFFRRYAAEICDVDIQVDGGGWENIATYTALTTSGTVTHDISNIADGKKNVQVRWHYHNVVYHDYYWCIDNVKIQATVMAPVVKGDYDLDCSVEFDELAKTISAWLSTSTEPGWDSTYDISKTKDGVVNLLDLAVFANGWLIE